MEFLSETDGVIPPNVNLVGGQCEERGDSEAAVREVDRAMRGREKDVAWPSAPGHAHAFLFGVPSVRWGIVVEASVRRDAARTCFSEVFDLNQRERIAYLELVLERLRLVPKGHWKLARLRRGFRGRDGALRCAAPSARMYLPG